MKQHSKDLQTRRMTQAVTMALASLMAGGHAYAQTTAASGTAPAADMPVQTVQIVGTRASQEGSIAKKKNADTASDSIIAEDVGAFPDRNIADAISRVAGVAVDRGSFGEGITVSIRGNGPELTRVELDGQGVQQAGGTDMLGGIRAGQSDTGGRGVEMRQLSSDLIKSVEVVKGSTAAMSEGSLGGGVLIQTRNGLDFKKDYLSIRAAGQQNSINKKVNPNLNLVGVKKFMDGRLGVLVNVSKQKLDQEAHSINQGGSSSVVGQVRPYDFDKSPEKTVALRPDTLKLDDPLSTTPIAISNLAAGGTFQHATPQQILEKSAAAKTKEDCYAAFPLFTNAQENLFGAANSNNRNTAINTRQNELFTCLGQWDDWINSPGRFNTQRYKSDRNAGDIRFDFKVDNNLTVYFKHSRSNDTVIQTSSDLTFGGYSFNPAYNAQVTGPNGFSGVTYTETAFPLTGRPANGAAVQRTLDGKSGYYMMDDKGLAWRTGATVAGLIGGAAQGIISNINPATVKVDSTHHVTSYDIADGSYSVNNTRLDIETKSRYSQAGANYKNRWIRADLLLGDSRSEFSRYEKRAGIGGYSGPTNVSVLSNGIWSYTPTGAFDPTNPDNFMTLRDQLPAALWAGNAFSPPTPAYSTLQQARVTGTSQLPLQNARINESFERTLKLDTTINTGEFTNDYVPSIRVGYNRRKSGYTAWSNGGMTVQEAVGTWNTPGYVPGIYVPNSNQRTTWQVCENTPGSLGAGGKPCAYGYTPSTDPRTGRQGAIQITPDQFRDIFRQSMTVQPTGQFYGGDKDRPASLTNGWTELDINKFYELLGVPNYDLSCIKTCVGSDGKTYSLPTNQIVETVDAGYLMADFAVDRIPGTERALPFGVEFDGNVGVRAVRTKVHGTGQMTFQVVRINPATYNPQNPTASNGTTTYTFSQDTAIGARTTDYLPSANLNMWLLDRTVVARYSWGKTVARPPAGKLIPSSTCVYNETFSDQLDPDGTPRDQGCSGTMGNPELQPMTNKNQNLSFEWYPNKDNMFSVAFFKQEGIIGAPTLVESINGTRFLAGQTNIDAQTGFGFSELDLNYRRWNNQLPSTRKGTEVSFKTAFTFLPWYLRYLGTDANYTRNKSSLTGTAIVDPITGTVMPVAGEPHHSWNASLWYDDGKLTARVAVQFVAEKFNCISGCGQNAVNMYPIQGLTNVRNPAYSPVAPNFTLGTRYIDAKIGYRINDNIEVFAEGRNLGRIHTGNTTGGISSFADGTPNVFTDAFAGATYMAGVNFKFE